MELKAFQAPSAVGLPLLGRAHRTDAGYDLRLTEDVSIRRYHCALFPTGTTIDTPTEPFELGGMPCLWAFIVFPRTGLGGKDGLINGAWIVDSGFRDPKGLTLRMWNWGRRKLYFKRGDRVAQGCFIPVAIPRVRLATHEEINWLTDRGAKGAGSTKLA